MKTTVVRAGLLTSVQDSGRFGFRELGVSSGGALDSYALRVANLLAGNDECAAGLEITLGGLELRFADDRAVAWCGGEFEVRVGSALLPAGHTAVVQAGEEFKIAHPRAGCRSWLAISGGIDVPIVLESRSTDLRAGFGGFNGRALRNGDELPLGEQRQPPAFAELRRGRQTGVAETISSWSAPTPWSRTAVPNPILRVIRGGNWDRFDASTLKRFTSEPFTVTPDSDRMGARLEGPELKREDPVDLISEAVAPGTIQVPPSGQPILLLGDCQTIGGYPKIAHVISVDLGQSAQLRAGDIVRFVEVSPMEAHQLLIERERELERFKVGLSLQDS